MERCGDDQNEKPCACFPQCKSFCATGPSPITAWLGIHDGTTLRSLRGDRTPSTLPNMEERPRKKSMMKNNTAQTCEPGIDNTASVNMMKARPVPDALWRGRRRRREVVKKGRNMTKQSQKANYEEQKCTRLVVFLQQLPGQETFACHRLSDPVRPHLLGMSC